MTKKQNNSGGFTLIELIMVIVVLGFLAVSALPKFVDLTAKAKEGNEKGVVGGVRAGIATQLAKSFADDVNPPVFPSALDAVAAGATCNTAVACFSTVIPGGITDGNWIKTSGTVYSSPLGTVFTYTSSDGAFK